MNGEVENAQSVSLENHHMIPRCGVYFKSIYHLREEAVFQVELTREGHKCQHDILYKVFGDFADQRAVNFSGFKKNPLPGQRAMAEARRTKIRLTSPDGLVTIHNSMTEAAEYLGTSHSAVSHCCNGKSKTTMKHKAEYYERN